MKNRSFTDHLGDIINITEKSPLSGDKAYMTGKGKMAGNRK